jgi:DHA2 family multidrug resistance protein
VIVALAVTAVIGFIAFLIWELTDKNPIVNIRVFRHRSFVGAVITISLTFGAFFSSIVLVPLWLQTSMGYTATWSGYVTAFGGVLAVVMSPIVPILMRRFDARALVSFGVLWLAGVALIRSTLTTDANYWVLALPFLAQGFAMPFFFIPTNQIALSAVPLNEMASAAGLSNFLRTTSAAFATSIVTTLWENNTAKDHAELAGRLNNPDAVTGTLTGAGLTHAQALSQLDGLTTSQSVMLSTDHMFVLTSLVFVVAAMAVWASPKPNIQMGAPAAAGGH